MSGIRGMKQQIENLRQKLVPPPRIVTLVLEEGEPIPSDVLATLSPHDRLVVRQTPAGYLSGSEGLAIVEEVRKRLGLTPDVEPDIKQFTDEELTDYANWYDSLMPHTRERES